ncbi:hypothetical protein FOQG_12003 [Fusarium oxysporum f. sp. raphani 54005]|uniref:Uncharacterized protein n=1 Tax=Fusarium oxysporum f. sp. raphani 54005 TaxID=1089458 RepID=X0BPR3_FUSOX|nr:hypothetical protein FOQG_12003 [Fusarium oxysporum f. sp. raphani 54005]WKT38277.1 hypothetical protein QSH57_000095 [Fusarium oxysporum f. sp. vasinfectum]
MSLGTFTDIEARSECTVCSFLCLAISQSSFELDDTHTIAVELGRNSYMRSCEYRAAGTILYENAEEFQHHTQLEKMIVPSWRSSTRPGVAKPEVNCDRLRQWYTEIPSATDKSNDALPEGFYLVNIPEACLVETDGVQVPNCAT